MHNTEQLSHSYPLSHHRAKHSMSQKQQREGTENLHECCIEMNLTSLDHLRVRAVFHKPAWVCHVYCNFKIDFTCRITVIFGTLKDESLLINTLASNICFS